MVPGTLQLEGAGALFHIYLCYMWLGDPNTSHHFSFTAVYYCQNSGSLSLQQPLEE